MLRGMKSHSPTDRAEGMRVWAGWAALLLLIFVECCMVCRVGTDCWEAMAGQDLSIGLPHSEIAAAFR